MAQGVPGRLRPWIFLTFRHYEDGRSSAKSTGHRYPRRNPWYSLSEAESTSGHMVLPGIPQKKSPVTPPRIDPRTVRLIVQRLNHYDTPGPYSVLVFGIFQLTKTCLTLLNSHRVCQPYQPHPAFWMIHSASCDIWRDIHGTTQTNIILSKCLIQQVQKGFTGLLNANFCTFALHINNRLVFVTEVENLLRGSR